MDVDTIVYNGMDMASGHTVGKTRLQPNEVGDASALFGSTYILNMGLHYDRYVLSGFLPKFWAASGAYSAARIAATATKKTRASSVTGNIGESVAGLVCRRWFKATRLHDILPIVASSEAQTPDFAIRLRPMFPDAFRVAVGASHAVSFRRWPVESKAVETPGRVVQALQRAVNQLGTYWYERSLYEPKVCGYGVVVCLVYRSKSLARPRTIGVHVFTPRHQTRLLNLIDHYQSLDDRPEFLRQLAMPSALQRCLNGFV